MPSYLYRCDCGEEIVVERSIHETPAAIPHSGCSGTTRQVLSAIPMTTSNYNPRQAPPSGSKNSWEKGIATDHRGVPYTDNGKVIPVKKFAQHRHKYEGRIRELRNSPNPF
jgi:hypothetical protein